MTLDDTDRAILYHLQEDSRTHEEIADRIGVSASTVSNRIRDLEKRGVLRDYRPVIDYEAADVPYHLLFVCTAPVAERASLCDRAVDLPNVVNVRELVTGTRNVHVEVVGTSSADVEAAVEDVAELGLEIEDSELLAEEYCRPFDQFGVDGRNGGST